MNAGRHRGFTLIELVCVALVLALLLTAALPQLRQQWRGLQTERATMEIAQGLRTARVLAIAQGRQVDWVWQPEPRSIQLAASAQDAPLEPRWQRPRALSDGVTLSVRQASGAVERVSFFPDGTSGATDGTVSTTTVDVAPTAGPAFQVIVDGARGRVTMRRTPRDASSRTTPADATR